MMNISRDISKIKREIILNIPYLALVVSILFLKRAGQYGILQKLCSLCLVSCPLYYKKKKNTFLKGFNVASGYKIADQQRVEIQRITTHIRKI